MADLGFIHCFEPRESASRTLLLLHGTGGDENDLLELGRALDSQATLLSPRGKVLEGNAPRFFRRLAEGLFDEEDLVARAGELSSFIDAASVEYEFPIQNLTAVGYSNGANIAAAMLLLGMAKFRSAVLFRAMLPLSRIDVPSLTGYRILMSNGSFDPIIPLPNAQRLGHIFQSAGAQVELRIQPSGHELTTADVEAAREWLRSQRGE